MTAWTKQQLDCLKELGIPLWALTQPSLQGGTPEITPQNQYFYRLGPWTFRFDEKLPVTGLSWLNELAAHSGEQPAQCSASEPCIDVQPYLRTPLEAAQKRELWQLLSQSLC